MAGLACAWLVIASAAHVAFGAAGRFEPLRGEAGTAVLRAPLDALMRQPAPQSLGPVLVHTVAAVGMHGWQIAQIAIGAALFAATGCAARRATTRRHRPPRAPEPSATVTGSNTTARSNAWLNICTSHRSPEAAAKRSRRSPTSPATTGPTVRRAARSSCTSTARPRSTACSTTPTNKPSVPAPAGRATTLPARKGQALCRTDGLVGALPAPRPPPQSGVTMAMRTAAPVLVEI